MHPLLNNPTLASIEEAVSIKLARTWKLTDFKDLKDFASHPAGILSDGHYEVFAKFSNAAHGQDQFEVELATLKTLSELAGISIPNPIDIVMTEKGCVLLLEAVQAIERSQSQWRDLGRTLAQIHRIRGNQFGYHRQGYFGPLFQDNRPMSDWRTFFTERRLWVRLLGAIDSGNLSSDAVRQVERLIQRLPQLDIPDVQPTLLHGDAQQNNFISTRSGTFVIDPAIYYGHPEMDLAYVDYFQPVPEAVFEGYREELPIESGFMKRRNLWRVPAYLAAVQVEGVGYLGKLMAAVQKYL